MQIFIQGGARIVLAVFLANAPRAAEAKPADVITANNLISTLGGTNAVARDNAAKALVQLGTNALPIMLAETRTLGQFLAKDKTNFDLSVDIQRRYSGLRRAFETVGAAAKPAAPELVALLEDGSSPSIAAEMLTFVDTNAAATAFARGLTNRQLTVRIASAQFVGRVGFGTNQEQGIRDLLLGLNFEATGDKPPELRSACAGAIGILRINSSVVVPAMIDRLQRERNLACQAQIIKAIGRFGENAKAAIPLLQRLAQDTDPIIKSLAVKSLTQIEGKKQ